jgi:hypothetical protein
MSERLKRCRRIHCAIETIGDARPLDGERGHSTSFFPILEAIEEPLDF